MKINHNILAIIACLLWGSAFYAGKICLAYLNPIFLAIIRLFFASLILSFFIKSNPIKVFLKDPINIIKLSLLKSALTFLLFNFGLNLVNGSTGAIIIGLSPVVSMLLATIFIPDDKLSSRKIFGMILGILAIVLLTINTNYEEQDGKNQIFGVLLLVLNILCVGYGDIITKKRFKSFYMPDINFIQNTIGCLILFIIAVTFKKTEFNLVLERPTILIWILWLSIITSVSVSLWFEIVNREHVKLTDISMWKLLIPLVGAISNWILVKQDKPTVFSVLALFGIMISILVSLKYAEDDRRSV